MVLVLGVLLFLASPVAAQHQSPYSGAQARPIKALSEAQLQGYLNGEGMGYAMAAELNHYPGPRHVLELAPELDLTDEQEQRTREAFEAMQSEARALGERVVEAEAELDRLFAGAEADPVSMQTVLDRIAKLQARLRGTHLRAHITMRQILNPDQIARYDELRGYTDRAAHDPAHSQHLHQH